MNTIGKLAKTAGVGVETIRFYERKGLLKQPSKTKSGSFRVYSDEDACRIRFIKRAQELGFTLKEVQELMTMNSQSKTKLGDLLEKIQSKMSEIDSKIADLKRIKVSLKEMEEACQTSPESLGACQITKAVGLKGKAG